jgi:tetratricopeptide (TPR) repeat protein
MVISLATEHSDTHAALRARVENLPDVSGFVNEMMARQKGMAPGRTVHALDAVPAPKPATVASGDLQARFDELAGRGDRAAALQCGQELLRAHADDARALNNFAWALLTEPRYGQQYDELALEVSKRSNEVSGHDNWYYLDTLALACFRTGHARKAVELEERALERAAGSSGADDVRAALERYRAALAGGGSR